MDSTHPESSGQSQPPQPGSKSKRPWVTPELIELPRLTDLTLQTSVPIPGFGDPGSGSTVF